jgi:hypothetical protein
MQEALAVRACLSDRDFLGWETVRTRSKVNSKKLKSTVKIPTLSQKGTTRVGHPGPYTFYSSTTSRAGNPGHRTAFGMGHGENTIKSQK